MKPEKVPFPSELPGHRPISVVEDRSVFVAVEVIRAKLYSSVPKFNCDLAAVRF